jgi:hypothetical protein
MCGWILRVLQTNLAKLIILLAFGILFGFPGPCLAGRFKVLVVFSYEQDMRWVKDIQEGIGSVLHGVCDVRYFYMNTKTAYKDGPRKAQQAFEIYKAWMPDGVITADDNAQSMFVLPYLRDRVKTPVMFCGVDGEPETYGYPASNVSGILERNHISHSIAFAQQLVPTIQTIGFISKQSPTGQAFAEVVRQENTRFPARFEDFFLTATLEETLETVRNLSRNCDALYTAAWGGGVPDRNGHVVPEDEIIRMIAETFGKPTIGSTRAEVGNGLLCSIVHTGQEQGETAAKQLLQAMAGKPVNQIPITRNRKGKRIINLKVLRALGIKPKPEVLMGTELIETGN